MRKELKEEIKKTVAGLTCIAGFGGLIALGFFLSPSQYRLSHPIYPIMYAGTLKRGQQVSFTYNGKTHQVQFDSSKTNSLDSAPFKTEGLEESITRYFTLDGESRQIDESVVFDGTSRFDMSSDNSKGIGLTKTRGFRIYPRRIRYGNEGSVEVVISEGDNAKYCCFQLQ